MQRGTLLRENNAFGGLSDAIAEHCPGNWCEHCELFRLHTEDPSFTMPPAAICQEEWVGSRPSFTIGGVTAPLASTFEGCLAGTIQNNATRNCDLACPPNQFFAPCVPGCLPIPR